MNLTVRTECLSDGRWKASLAELPAIFYMGRTEAEVTERIGRLTHALRSEHIKIEAVGLNGDVILTLKRTPEEEYEEPRPKWMDSSDFCAFA